MALEMATLYDPTQVEQEAYAQWLKDKSFHASACVNGDQRNFAIVIPPPNVTAALHIGHALNNTIQDILVRFRRMQGCNTLWMPGTDHAGIATQTVVEKRVLAEEGKRRIDFGRDEFIEKIQAWKDEYEVRITEQLHAMGCSCDWDRQRFTMDETCAKAVREAFFRLFKDGLIYRGKRLVNWDPATETALADDEVEMQEVDGHFWYLNYPLVDPVEVKGEMLTHVTVATTRPETMLGDTGVAINPKDPRAAALVGKFVRLPIVERVIPIVGDDYVVLPDAESDDAKARFATGFLKVTPAHDPNDWEIGQRHGLGVINVMATDATISHDHGWSEVEENIHEGANLLGMDRFEAREAIVSWFRSHNLLEEVRPYSHSVGHSYRSHVPIEPYLSDQWYVRVTDDRLAGAALRAMDKDQRSESEGCVWKEGESFASEGKDWEGGMRFHPERYAKNFQAWHENLRDWCISRQLWWGHRIPVWRRAQAPAEITPEILDGLSKIFEWQKEGRLAVQYRGEFVPLEKIEKEDLDLTVFFICVRDPEGGDVDVVKYLEDFGLEQDPDVLDTWFSSGLWPLSTMGWPDETDLLETFNPGNVLCTAREIITLWVSRMVMFNLYFRDCLPFRDVFIHAMIQDGQGQKMSKSLGNGVDPLDIIHSHGADAMRFTLATMTTQTQDVRLPVDIVCPHTGETFEPKIIKNRAGLRVTAPIQSCPSDKRKKFVTSYGVVSGEVTASDEMPLARNTSSKFDIGRNFANKLWNASRFALTNLEGAGGVSVSVDQLAWEDRWILSRLAQTAEVVTGQLEQYKFSEPANALYRFFWNDLCDWYLEILKPRMRDKALKPVAQKVLAYVMDGALRLLHPIIPFITENIYQQLNSLYPDRQIEGVAELVASENLVSAAWPGDLSGLVCDSIAGEMELCQSVVRLIRDVRVRYQVAPREGVEVSIKVDDAACVILSQQKTLLCHLNNLSGLTIAVDVAKPANAAVAVEGAMEVYIHDVIDADAEKERLLKQKEEIVGFIANGEKKLGNENFVSRAKPEVVQRERDRLADLVRQLATIESNLSDFN
jgi:valyl-tRNA synthetase